MEYNEYIKMLFIAIVEKAKPREGFESYSKALDRLLNISLNKKEVITEEHKKILNEIQNDEIGAIWLQSATNDYPNDFIYRYFYVLWKDDDSKLNELKQKWLIKLQTFNLLYHKYLLVIAIIEKLNTPRGKFQPKKNVSEKKLIDIFNVLITSNDKILVTSLDNWLYWFGYRSIENPKQMVWTGDRGACAKLIQLICGQNNNKVLYEAFGFKANPVDRLNETGKKIRAIIAIN